MHDINRILPRRPFVALRPRTEPTPIAFCGTTVVEVYPGVYVQTNLGGKLWSHEPAKLPDGQTVGAVLTLWIDSR